MDSGSGPASPIADASTWKEIVAKYRQSSTWKAVWQLVNSIGPYALIWCAMYWSISVSYWLTLPLAVLAVGFLIRIFIIFHDCGHGSFFKSRRANDIVGFITGVLTVTPYYHWRWEHAIHHGTSGDLDRRGKGDVWTLTVQEYLESSRWRRFAYRLARNPIVLFIIAPLYVFVFEQRFISADAPKRERHSVYWTNLALLAVAGTLSFVFGIWQYLLIQATVTTIAGTVGIWLFYVQHQFDGVYWERGAKWDYTTAAIQGSSFYKLPRILQWFSGNIGFHHIHHLSPRIPNYNLARCHESEPLFQQVKPMTLLTSFRSLAYRLWDEQRRKLVGFHDLRVLRQQANRVERC
jgi:omega-6 fatty acid desaturase (delta-12 desaturase)